MVYTESQKRAIYNWRAKNIDKVRESQRKLVLKAYYENPEYYRTNAKKYYHYKKEAGIFRNILLERNLYT